MKSAMDWPHHVYLLKHQDGLYVGITTNLQRRLQEHSETKIDVILLHSFTVPTRREAEGVEASFHQLQKKGADIKDYFCHEFFLLHSLWFHKDHKGFPKHLTQVPRLNF